MKILVALPRFPYPLLKGDQLRAFYFLQELSKDHELYVLCVSDSRCQDHEIQVKSFCKHLEIIILNKFRLLKNLTEALFSDIPFQVAYFKHPQFKRRFAEICEAIKPDICFVQLIRMGPNIPDTCQVPRYLDYMDCFTAGYEKRAKLSNWFMRFWVSVEAKRLRKYEGVIFSRFQGHSIISEADKAALPEAIRQQITIIPNGVSSYFFEELPQKTEREYLVIFTGNMGYYPNIEAVRYLVNQIMPIIWQEIPTAKVCIAGANPASEVLKLAKDKRVTVTGYVPDIRLWLLNATCFVAPLFSGSGLQNKLLEAMAVGVPVITSSMANAALKAPKTTAILEANSPQEFAQAILKLTKTKDQNKSLIMNAREYIHQQYHWPTITKKLVADFEKVYCQSSVQGKNMSKT